jgi:hypothetical protein
VRLLSDERHLPENLARPKARDAFILGIEDANLAGLKQESPLAGVAGTKENMAGCKLELGHFSEPFSVKLRFLAKWA